LAAHSGIHDQAVEGGVTASADAAGAGDGLAVALDLREDVVPDEGVVDVTALPGGRVFITLTLLISTPSSFRPTMSW